MNISIVGSQGGFGSLFDRLLGPSHNLTRIDVRSESEERTRPLHPCDDKEAVLTQLASSDVLLYCVPEAVVVSTIDQYLPVMPRTSIVVDICSTKRRVVEMIAQCGYPVSHLSIHPMFGPSVGFSGQNVVCIEHEPSERSRRFLDELRSWGAVLHTMTADGHDRAVVGTQVLCHAALMSYALSVRSLGLSPKELRAVETPNSRILTALAARLSQSDPELYLSIQQSADQHPRAAMVRAASQVSNSVEHDGAFAALVQDIVEWLGDDAEAYRSLAQGLMARLQEIDRTADTTRASQDKQLSSGTD